MPTTNSPFRYPGGKTQLYNFIDHLLKINNINGTYVEPFAGGAGVAIKLLINNKVQNIWINDYDVSIYSVWFYILNEPKKLIQMIQSVPFDYKSGHTYGKKESLEFWHQQKKIYLELKNNGPSLKLAFATLFLNRTNRSGIISGGPVGGLNQSNKTQIYARFNKQTLIKKINTVASLKSNIKLTNYDALKLTKKIRNSTNANNSFIFFDPPYFKQGKNLYFTSFDKRGHQKLSSEILSLTNYFWITTYDVDKNIELFYSSCSKRFKYQLKYFANNKRRGTASELLFASDILNIESFSNVELSEL